jgi:hypothetical protein
MPDPSQEPSDVSDALNRLSAAMEKLQDRYDSTERANRRVRIALILALAFLGVATYMAISPITDQLRILPQIISQAIPRLNPEMLDPETAAAEKQRLLERLTPEERVRIEEFEERQQWISDYIATSERFNPGAAIALFLSDMSNSVKVMPELYAEVHSMTEELRLMNSEMQAINGKMDSLPVLANEIQGMHVQMGALPVLATEVKGIHFYMSLMAKDMDATMGEAGRMMPWNW